ncbi:chromatin assembly factor 1 subunit B [Pararge aegeria]|uniref:Jg6447 protein n=4 Tax=Pararge aegeria TaxID=116150 RepID=A0A8S4RUT6_9NEOP|nr:chromatin assembly factor 1 subunit B [Pararge aegeria]XP_039751684.1 chromatin assembly factor 1 subunit B [Pararge aegeria]CAH2240532.1 jg6447 [Pararge aegeria aegeria]
MKLAIPEISWHNRDPVLSVDFQPKSEPNDPLRLATGGTDSHVLIWYISTKDSGSVNLEMAADLTKHQKAVNVVRWSPSGQYLASGDDESIIFVWKQKTEEPAPALEGEEQYKETWVIHKILRGHMEDILDLSWNSTSTQLASGSVDNKLLVWDIARGRHSAILSDHKGFVQGVAWDPRGQLIASASTDRVFRTFDVSTKKVVSRSSKAVLPFPKQHPLHGTSVRLYHDDTLQTYYRRLHFSPDGLLIAVPAGSIEPEQGKVDMKPINAVYIYTRYSLKVPACVLPCAAAALVARWSPRRYAARRAGPRAALAAPARMLLAVATKRSLLIYDTQQRTPLALVTNMHYTRLTDLTWSPDGLILVASSTDGFCSVVSFADGELGEVLPEEVAEPCPEPATGTEDQQNDKESTDDVKEIKTKIETKQTTHNISKIDSFIKFKTPSSGKSPKKAKIESVQQKTPVKYDILVETAMQSWSDNSSNDVIKPKESEPMDVDKNDDIMIIEDSEDIKLIYEETETKTDAPSPKQIKLDEKSPNITDESSLEFKSISKENKKDSNVKKIESKSETKHIGTKSESIEIKRTTESTTTVKNEKGIESKINETPSKCMSPKQCETPSLKQNESTFMKQAKVTDMQEAGTVKAAPSPKAPRRVSFVTLSSPKNSKKKC